MPTAIELLRQLFYHRHPGAQKVADEIYEEDNKLWRLIHELLEQSRSKCNWQIDERHGYWLTGCGESFLWDDIKPPRFCPGCGKPVIVALDATAIPV